MLAAVLGRQCPLDNEVLIEIGNVVVRIVVAVIVEDIGADVGKVGARDALPEEVQAVIEFMIADVANRVVKLIHRFVNRMNIAGLQPALPRNEVAERIALQKIAVVDKNAVTDFGTG